MSTASKIHFSGLNALRFFAAYFVVLHHGETIRAKYGLPNFEHYSFFRNGSLAVSFFFVLSGFLITYLLLSEIRKTHDISLSKFYMRRVLRIFPLYYLLVFIGLIAIPFFLNVIHFPNTQPYSTAEGGVLFLFFLSFVVNALFGSHFLEPLWSIGVEEYFYLIWAPLFKFFKQHILAVITSVIIIKSLTILYFAFQKDLSPPLSIVADILLSLKFELMAIGGLGAYFVFHKRQIVENTIVFKPFFQILCLTVLILRLFFHSYFVDSQSFVYKILFLTPVVNAFTEGGLFLWLILNVSVNPRPLFQLNNPILEKLGEISYGIYMYQMLVIFGVVLVFKKIMAQMSPSVSTLFFYIVTTIGVVGISWLSKRYFEDWFLQFKRKFE
ncbi:MAG: acyltransferase [Saprospiraceae bacterium]|nr:acyltransferase [Saprospiraceae bacterium]